MGVCQWLSEVTHQGVRCFNWPLTSVDEWLPDGHLARFVVDVVEQLDLSALTRRYAGRGHKAHHPAVLLSLLVYGYATGVISSRKIERANYDSVASGDWPP